MNDFNIRHVIIIALGTNRNCWNEIDNIYYEKEREYHEAYLNSKMKEDLVKKSYTMKSEDMINKLIGIFEISYKKNTFLLIEKIIRRIHPSVVNYVKNATKIDLDDFIYKYKIVNVTEIEQFGILSSLIYLGAIYNKQVMGSSTIIFVQNKWDEMINTIHVSQSNFNMDKSILAESMKYYQIFGLNKSDVVNSSLETFISDDIERNTYKELGLDVDFNNELKYKENLSKLKEIDISIYENARENQFNKGFCKYVGCFSRYVKTLGLNSEDMFIETSVNNEVLETIFCDFVKSVRYNNVPSSESELYIASCLFIHNLISLYKDCKDFYLDKEKEEKFTELKKIEEDINKQKESFEGKVFDYKRTLKENNKEINELKRKLKNMEKENNKLTAINSKLNEEIKDLNDKNKDNNIIINNLNTEIEKIKELSQEKEVIVSFNDKINYINKFEIGIFGGMNNIKSISDVLINTSFYDSQNQDISSISNLDMIFINSDFFSHSFSEKIKSVNSKYNVPIRYISGTNFELIIEEIYNQLKILNITK